MRKYLSIIFALIFLIGCQKNVIANFDIHIENLDKYNTSYHDLSKVEIYKDNNIFKILKSDFPIGGLERNIKIDSIKEGKYSFVYESIFGKQIKTNITVDDSRTYRISLNPDRLNEKIKNLVFENIKNEEVQLKYRSSGCFHLNEDSITILNKGNEYFVKKDDHLRKIDKKTWAYFVNLENKIRHIHKDRGCTSVDSFIFKYKGKSDTVYDGTCNFDIVSNIINYRKKNKI
ncbi:hypothetical protein SAMN05443633_11756 [Chryseobacterium arachidis]|uniref:Lipoprotein n=1 Tax=Chryseobacterium arachidis TaxID=1416778 RepID=A0A1M5KQL5_9FLAO|nr:hypothetical protein [Chryseobacterium arachidis]SHG55077.1 hypothetical protein SAMN05443633_11756 [Chryseobacterium arachidis]